MDTYYVGLYFRRCICPVCRFGPLLERATTFQMAVTFDPGLRCQLCGQAIGVRQLALPTETAYDRRDINQRVGGALNG